MSNTLQIGLSQQMALRRQMDVVANNLANMNTTAFKAEGLVFHEYLKEVETGEGKTELSYVIDYGLNRDMSIGAITVTNNPLEFAIKKNGYFVVETDDGLRYTRNGQFSIDAEGQLVNRDNHPVLDIDGNAIFVPSGTEHVLVDQDGAIKLDGRPGQQIHVVTFESPNAMRQEGAGLFSTDQRIEDVLDPQIVQGALEASNVMPILEMTKMIETQRAYRSTADLLDKVDQSSLKAIRALGGEA